MNFFGKNKKPTLDKSTEQIEQNTIQYSVASASLNEIKTSLNHSLVRQTINNVNNSSFKDLSSIFDYVELNFEKYRSAYQSRFNRLGSYNITMNYSDDLTDDNIKDKLDDLVSSVQFLDLITMCNNYVLQGFVVIRVVWGYIDNFWQPVEFQKMNLKMLCIDEKGRPQYTDEYIDKGFFIDYENLNFNHIIIKHPDPSKPLITLGYTWSLIPKYLDFEFANNLSMRYLEQYATPIAVAKYQPLASETENQKTVGKLKAQIAKLFVNRNLIVPNTSSLELTHQASLGELEVFQAKMNEIADSTIQLLLGGTMTIQEGSSKAQATVHDDSLTAIVNYDAKKIATELQLQLIVPFCYLNFNLKEIPHLTIDQPASDNRLIDAQILTQINALIGDRATISLEYLKNNFGVELDEQTNDTKTNNNTEDTADITQEQNEPNQFATASNEIQKFVMQVLGEDYTQPNYNNNIADNNELITDLTKNTINGRLEGQVNFDKDQNEQASE